MKLTSIFIFFLILFSYSVSANETNEPERARVDVLQSQLNNMMQSTASWLDNIDDELNDNDSKKASASGYLQLSWLPRTAKFNDIDAKFKVQFHLPKWNDRLALVIDNDDEDERLLDYETDHSPANHEGVNIAVQYIKEFNKQFKVRNRIGLSRKQIYLRSEILFNWEVKKVSIRLQPRLDYFLQDGWGPSVKGVANYPLEKSYFSLSASWQKMQNESRSRRKVGFFHIKSIGQNQLLVSGAQYNKSNNKSDVPNENYTISVRYRNLIYKSWMYFEIEPFIEFNELNNFRREAGIALNLLSYYGD